MMLREECKIGMEVLFGRRQGEKTRGRIIALNPTRAKVETLEERGRNGRSAAGTQWAVPYIALTPINVSVEPLDTSPHQPVEDILMLQAIAEVYDKFDTGHLPNQENGLTRKLKGLFLAFGREVTREEVLKWERERR